MSELARRYAEALYDLSPDEEPLRATAQDMMADEALWEALRSPAVQAWEKTLLAEKGRMALLPEILEAFHTLALDRQGTARCRLTCVRVPGGAELEKLKAALCRLHHKADVVFEIRTDPSLLGGFTLELEGVTYDKSVRGALSGLKRQLEERRMA